MVEPLEQRNTLASLLHNTARRGGSLSPTEIMDDPIQYLKDSSLMAPAAALGCALILAGLMAAYGWYRCKCRCCTECRRAPDKRPTTGVWKGIAGFLSSVFVLAVVLQFVYVLYMTESATRLVATSTKVSVYMNTVHNQTILLRDQTKLDLVLLDDLLATNTTGVNGTVVDNLQNSRSALAAAVDAADSVVNQTDIDIGLDNVIDTAATYITLFRNSGYENAAGLFVFVVLGIVFVWIPTRWLSLCLRVILGFIMFIFFMVWVTTSTVTYTVSIGIADAVYEPLDYLSAKFNNSLIDYFAGCTDPLTGGPINPNFDTVLGNIGDIRRPLDDFVVETETNRVDLHPKSVALQSNVTETERLLNATRILVSCTDIHNIVAGAFYELGGSFLESLFIYTWAMYFGAVSSVFVLIWFWTPLHTVVTHKLLPQHAPDSITDATSAGQNYPYPSSS